MNNSLRNYSFVLNWDDLDEDLRTQKIADYIDHQEANSAYTELNKRDLTESGRLAIKVRDAEVAITAHFPIYF